MKKSIALAALVAVSSVFITGCSKDDSEAPIITLKGSNPFQLEMLDTYVEPGATANDNEDGDISSSISVDDNDIENRLPDTYNVYYSVSDAAGNPADAVREVVVFATNNAMAKSYTVIDSCFSTGGVFGLAFNYSQVLTASGSNVLTFSNFGNFTPTPTMTATINGNGTINLPTQTVTASGGDNITFSLNTADPNKVSKVTLDGFILYYTLVNNTLSLTNNCVAYFTR